MFAVCCEKLNNWHGSVFPFSCFVSNGLVLFLKWSLFTPLPNDLSWPQLNWHHSNRWTTAGLHLTKTTGAPDEMAVNEKRACLIPVGLFQVRRTQRVHTVSRLYSANMLIIRDDASGNHKKVFKWLHPANYRDFGRRCPAGNCSVCSSIDNVSVCFWTHNYTQRQGI